MALRELSSAEESSVEKAKEPGSVEVRLGHWDSVPIRLGIDRRKETFTLLQAIVLLKVVDDGHVEDFSIIFISVVSGSQLSKLLISDHGKLVFTEIDKLIQAVQRRRYLVHRARRSVEMVGLVINTLLITLTPKQACLTLRIFLYETFPLAVMINLNIAATRFNLRILEWAFLLLAYF